MHMNRTSERMVKVWVDLGEGLGGPSREWLWATPDQRAHREAGERPVLGHRLHTPRPRGGR